MSISKYINPTLIDALSSLIWETSYRKEKAWSLVRRNRVIQCSPTRYMVEAKKYPNKPSKMYIIQRRLNAPEYDLACNCEHSGVYPSPFNLCSHALACLISVCLKVGDTSLLAMRDVAKRKEQEHKDGVPIVGNEYPDHTKQKKRIHDLLDADGWHVEYEKEVQCNNWFTGEPNKYPYSLDVFGAKQISKWNDVIVQVGIEIHREETGGGHGSKITGPKDRNRAQEIRDQHFITVIPFNVSHMKAASDEDILDEIYQRLGIVS